MSVPDGFIDDPTFMPLLDRLLECFEREIAATGGPGFCYLGHMVGDMMPIALLGTECSGVGWVRPAEVFGSTDFPEPSTVMDLRTPRAMGIEIGVARNYPRPSGRNAYVTPDVMRDTARIIQADRRAMERAVRCCFGRDFVGSVDLGAWAPVPAEGQFVGGVITVTARPGV